MAVAERVRMVFDTDEYQTISISVRNTKVGDDAFNGSALVAGNMHNLIISNAYDTRGRGELKAANSAFRILNDRKTFDVEEEVVE